MLLLLFLIAADASALADDEEVPDDDGNDKGMSRLDTGVSCFPWCLHPKLE